MSARREKDDHGLYGIVFGTALVLALVLGYYAVSRIFESAPPPAEVFIPAARVETAPPPAPAGEARSSPSRIPPMRVLRVEGEGGIEKQAPPAVPLPPIRPDR